MKGHYLVLTDNQLASFNDRFKFEIWNDTIVTSVSNYPNRKTLHNDAFQVIMTIDGHKFTMRISKDAIQLWKASDCKLSLITIQNTINQMKTTQPTFNIENVKEYLNIK